MYPIKLEFGHLAIQGDHKAVKKGSLPLDTGWLCKPGSLAENVAPK